jgi:hypothetical protein
MGWSIRAVIALAAALLLLVGTAVASVTYLGPPAEPTYTPGQFAAVNLRPRLQVGQTLRITGILQSWWFPASGVIVQGPSGARGRWRRVGVFVIFGPHNPILSRLRRLPLVAPFVPPTPDHPLINKVATFRVRVIPCQASIPLCPWRSPALQLADGGTL